MKDLDKLGNADKSFNILVVGQPDLGKSELIGRFTGNKFPAKKIDFNGQRYQLNITELNLEYMSHYKTTNNSKNLLSGCFCAVSLIMIKEFFHIQCECHHRPRAVYRCNYLHQHGS